MGAEIPGSFVKVQIQVESRRVRFRPQRSAGVFFVLQVFYGAFRPRLNLLPAAIASVKTIPSGTVAEK
jgi:hypothetical protein